jgi:hypothetical protein
MKLVRLATIAALTSTTLIGGVTAFSSEQREVTTTGQVEFTSNNEDNLEVVPPETDPEVEIDPEVPGTTGPLSIVKAVTMNFGSQVISNQDKTYSMIAETARLANPEEGGPTEVPYVSFAQVQDTRGLNAGWNLQVSLSDFTSSTQNNVLTGAEIRFSDGRVKYEGSNQTNAPTTQGNHVLSPNAGALPIMTAESGKGAGVSSVVWGNQAALDTQFAAEGNNPVTNDAIKLFVPGETAKDATTYQSTLTWELVSTPGEDA